MQYIIRLLHRFSDLCAIKPSQYYICMPVKIDPAHSAIHFSSVTMSDRTSKNGIFNYLHNGVVEFDLVHFLRVDE